MEGYINQYEIRRYKNGLKLRSLQFQSVTEKTRIKAGQSSSSVLEFVNPTSVLMHIWEIPQVLESLLNQVPTSELKKCRLVNKKWNQAACTLLRKLTFVNLALLDDVKLQEFWKLFRESQLTKFANPFKRYAISIQVIQSEIITNILCHPSTEMISLSYSTDQNITYYSKHFINLQNILQAHGENIRIFIYTFSNLDINITGEGWYSSELDMDKLHLPALKEFSLFIWSYSTICKQTSFWHFLRGIVLGSPNLHKFCTNADDPELLHYLLSACRTIKVLYLQKVSNPVLGTLLQAELPHLKSLGLIPNARMPNLNFELLADVLKNTALGIEELAMSKLFAGCDIAFPILPTLRKILLHDSPSSLRIINPERFPSLRSVYLAGFKTSSATTAQERCEYFSTDPHEGVEKFGLKCSLTRSCASRDEASKIKMEADLVFLMAYVCRQFPSIHSLYICMSKCLKGLVRSVIRFFPQVKFLKLELTGDVSFPEDIFTGRDSRMVNQAEELRKKPCLADLLCLKILVLSRAEEAPSEGAYLTQNAIKYGIAAIPALEIFQLDWYEGINIKIIKENLAHLSQVILVKSGGSTVDAKDEELRNEMINLKLSCNAISKGDEYHKTDMFDFKNYY